MNFGQCNVVMVSRSFIENLWYHVMTSILIFLYKILCCLSKMSVHFWTVITAVPTLPVFNPGIVNIHIKHPPEASVQVHQVSQLDDYHNNGHQQKGSQAGSSSSTSYSYHHSESSQKIQHHGYNMVYSNPHGYQPPHYQPVTSKNALGRCFQETATGQVHWV